MANRLKVLFFVMLMLLTVLHAKAQSTPPILEAVHDAGKEGLSLTVNSSVSDSATVEAVLIPFKPAVRIFGHETAKNYFVIELIVSNHNPQASLIIQSVFLDYSQWAIVQDNKLSNFCQKGAPPDDLAGPTKRLSCPAQIASAEWSRSFPASDQAHTDKLS